MLSLHSGRDRSAMRFLPSRDVRDVVFSRLERLASLAGTPVRVLAVRELDRASRRADNPTLLCSLPNLGIDPAGIVSDLHAERGGR